MGMTCSKDERERTEGGVMGGGVTGGFKKKKKAGAAEAWRSLRA